MSTGSVAARETVIVRLRPHIRRMFWPSVVLVGVALGIGYFAGTFAEEWQNLAVVGVGGAVVVLGWFIPLCRWLTCNYTITTRRIVLRVGVVVRIRQELLHSRGTDVTVRQSSLQSLFGSGDLIVNVSDDRSVVLRDVPSAYLVQTALNDLMEHAVQRTESSIE